LMQRLPVPFLMAQPDLVELVELQQLQPLLMALAVVVVLATGLAAVQQVSQGLRHCRLLVPLPEEMGRAAGVLELQLQLSLLLLPPPPLLQMLLLWRLQRLLQGLALQPLWLQLWQLPRPLQALLPKIQVLPVLQALILALCSAPTFQVRVDRGLCTCRQGSWRKGPPLGPVAVLLLCFRVFTLLLLLLLLLLPFNYLRLLLLHWHLLKLLLSSLARVLALRLMWELTVPLLPVQSIRLVVMVLVLVVPVVLQLVKLLQLLELLKIK
jgi:hypothetical protein